MALSIRNSEVERLARLLAARSAVSLTEAIRSALAERAERQGAVAQERFARIRAIGRRCAALPDLDSRPMDVIVGYDESGAF